MSSPQSSPAQTDPLYLTQRLTGDNHPPIEITLSLTADERTRSRYYFISDQGQEIYLRLARGTLLRQGDVLSDERGTIVQIIAKPEPVITVRAATALTLLKAAYHLGNRHVPLEVAETYLRFSPDPVLESMATQLGLEVSKDLLPFQPEAGAYSNHPHADSPVREVAHGDREPSHDHSTHNHSTHDRDHHHTAATGPSPRHSD